MRAARKTRKKFDCSLKSRFCRVDRNQLSMIVLRWLTLSRQLRRRLICPMIQWIESLDVTKRTPTDWKWRQRDTWKPNLQMRFVTVWGELLYCVILEALPVSTIANLHRANRKPFTHTFCPAEKTRKWRLPTAQDKSDTWRENQFTKSRLFRSHGHTVKRITLFFLTEKFGILWGNYDLVFRAGAVTRARGDFPL